MFFPDYRMFYGEADDDWEVPCERRKLNLDSIVHHTASIRPARGQNGYASNAVSEL